MDDTNKLNLTQTTKAETTEHHPTEKHNYYDHVKGTNVPKDVGLIDVLKGVTVHAKKATLNPYKTPTKSDYKALLVSAN